jgi:hypothetical protein
MKINADEILRLKARMKEINDLKLEEIEWVNDKGDTIVIDKETLDHWRFVGLSNCCFVEIVIYGDYNEMVKENPRP